MKGEHRKEKAKRSKKGRDEGEAREKGNRRGKM